MIVNPPTELNELDLHDILISYDHAFGLTVDDETVDIFQCGYTKRQREALVFQLKEFYRLIKRTLEEKYRFKGERNHIDLHNEELKRMRTKKCLLGSMIEVETVDESL